MHDFEQHLHRGFLRDHAVLKSFGCFAVSFVVQALGNNLNSGSEEALVYDSMKCLGQEEHYMGVYGRLNVLIEVAQGFATVAGGALAEFSHFWCYAACVVIAVLALLPVLWMAEPTQCGEAADTAGEGVEDAAEGTPAQRTIRETVKHHFAVSACILQKDVRIGKIIGFYSVVLRRTRCCFSTASNISRISATIKCRSASLCCSWAARPALVRSPAKKCTGGLGKGA